MIIVRTIRKRIRKNKKQVANLHEVSYTYAALSLAWKSHYYNALSSGLADHAVKLWDINASTQSSPVSAFARHDDKGSWVEWHPSQCAMLASMFYYRVACLLDGSSSASSTDNSKLIGKLQIIMTLNKLKNIFKFLKR